MIKPINLILVFLSLFVLINVIPNGMNFADAAIDTGKMIILKQDLLHNYNPLLNEAQIQECKDLHDDYTKLPEPEFNKKYLYHQFIGDCVLLYDDPIWQYDGEDRYDKISFKLVELRENLDELLKKQIDSRPEFTTKSITESEIPGTFLYIFEACAKNDPIDVTNILVASDKEIVPAVKFPDEFSIMPDTCEEFEVDIESTNSNFIRAHNLNEERDVDLTQINEPETSVNESNTATPIKSPHDQIKSGIDSKDIVCKQGLELILKNSDDSPACVFPATKIKLIDREWAKS